MSGNKLNNDFDQKDNQLIVVKEHNNLFDKAIKNLSKTIYFSNGSFKNIFIGMKRSKVIRAFRKYKNISNIPDEEKRELINKRYDNAYNEYLIALDNYVVSCIYPKVKDNKGSYEENKIIERYLEISNLKETEHMEYKYKRQRFLIEQDFFTVLKMKNLYFVETYKEFYVFKMDNIYKTLLRNYSIKLMEKDKGKSIYDEMFKELEQYIIDVLPYKMQVSNQDVYKTILKEYNKLERFKYEADNSNRVKYIEKNMLLLAISRDLFTHSLPLVAAEQCYVKLLKEARELIVVADTFSKKEEVYKLIMSLIEFYNIKLLSKKTYWDNPKIREEYKKFWDEYSRISKLENIDYSEYVRQKESLFIYYELKLLNRVDNDKYNQIKQFYRIKLKELKGLKKMRNKYINLENKKYTLKNKDDINKIKCVSI